jgi:protein SCO1
MTPPSSAVARLPWFRALALSLLLLAGGCFHRSLHWDLTDISGALPNLQFDLATKDRPHFTEADLRGKVVLMYFGYMHCPDVCPLTMARLGEAVRSLGKDADRVRILFISVDPKRDTPALLHAYAQAFSPEAIGATSSPEGIRDLAKLYRVAYQAEAPDPDGNYVVTHSKGVYVFDAAGRVRLLGSDSDSAQAFEHDLRQLLQSP